MQIKSRDTVHQKFFNMDAQLKWLFVASCSLLERFETHENSKANKCRPYQNLNLNLFFCSVCHRGNKRQNWALATTAVTITKIVLVKLPLNIDYV